MPINRLINKNSFAPSVRILNDIHKTETSKFYYMGLFKNIPQRKYTKVIKRLRSILSSYLFQRKETVDRTMEIGRQGQYRRLILQARNEIEEINRGPIGMLNQLKNRAGDIAFLADKNGYEMTVKAMIMDLLFDLEKTGFNMKNAIVSHVLTVIKVPKYDAGTVKGAVEALSKEIIQYMNDLTKPILEKVYKEVKHILPFQFNIVI